MPHIVVLDRYDADPSDISWDCIRSLGTVAMYDTTPPEILVERCSDADYIVSNKAIISEAHISQLAKLKCICISATGYNVVDTSAARANGVDVCNVAGYSTPSVAQHVFSLLLYITNHVAMHNQSVKNGEWNTDKGWSYFLKPISELKGRTMGLLGFGNIAREVAQIALAFGMKVIAYRNRPRAHDHADVKLVSLEELWSQSDVLSLHAPLNEHTTEIINKTTLNQMKSNSILINTGRGGLINEEDLAEVLLGQGIAYAALDVLTDEPPLPQCPLITIENCIITPHIAWVSQEARNRLLNAVAENIKAHIAGKPINVVN